MSRFMVLVPEKLFPTPEDIARLTDELIRSAGFSHSKILTIRDLSEKVFKVQFHPTSK